VLSHGPIACSLLAASLLAAGCAGDRAVAREDAGRAQPPPERLRIQDREVPEGLAAATQELARVPEPPPRKPAPAAGDPLGGPALRPEPRPPAPTFEEESEVLQAHGDAAQQASARKAERKTLSAREADLMKQPFSREVVASLIESRLPDVNYCYDLVVSSGVDVEGRVAVDFRIDPEGRVAGAEAREASIGHEGVVACVLNTVGGWVFPKPEGVKEVAVSYPFEFKLIR
jgi:TonB family protein